MRVQEYLPVVHRCAFRPRLRSRLTQGGRTFPWKPWAIGVQDSHLHLATHTGILSSVLSTAPYGTASPCTQRSPTTRTSVRIRSFGSMLSPGTFSAQSHSTSELLRIFKGWLLLSEPPSCLCISTSFSTQHAFWGLGWRSGLFPS